MRSPQLAPFRFVALMAHAFTVTLLFRAVPILVSATLALGADRDDILQREWLLVASICTTLGGLFAEAMCFTFGSSLGSPRLCLFSGVVHCLGGFFTAWALLDGWAWRSVPALFALFTLPPLACEVIVARPLRPVARLCAAAYAAADSCQHTRVGPCCAAHATKAAKGLVACYGWAAARFDRHTYAPPPSGRRGSGRDPATELT
jgi:hypothetical protein